MVGDVNKLFFFKSLLTMPSNVLPLHLKQTFLPIIWIFTEGEGDRIKSRLPIKTFSTLTFNALRICIAMIDIVEIKESLRDAISVILLHPVLG